MYETVIDVRIESTDLVDIDKVMCYQDNPFTGIAFRLNTENKIVEEVEYKEGLKDGWIKSYDEKEFSFNR